MIRKTRNTLVTVIVVCTVAWLILTLVVFLLNSSALPAAWLLASCAVYTVVFVLALLLLNAAQEDLAFVPGTARRAQPTGPQEAILFDTRRGRIEAHAADGHVNPDLFVNEGGQSLAVEHVETALDSLQPAAAERGAPTPATTKAGTKAPTQPRTATTPRTTKEVTL